jgi:dUTP pyrophosphatase
MDLCALLDTPVTLEPGERAKIPTGLAVEIPSGWEGQVRPRSGLAAKHGVTVLNAPGTIDADFRGELCVLLVNLGQESCTVETGERVAQLVIAPAARAEIRESTELSDTGRGSGGWGSTGTNSSPHKTGA